MAGKVLVVDDEKMIVKGIKSALYRTTVWLTVPMMVKDSFRTA